MRKQKETISVNGLWQARRTSGLEQKHVAKLLGHHSNDSISRYERGVCLPSVRNVIKLIIIYQTSLEQLFPEHFKCCRAELESRMSQIPKSLISRTARQVLSENIHLCTYEKLLDKLPTTKDELDAVKDHITNLAKKHLQF